MISKGLYGRTAILTLVLATLTLLLAVPALAMQPPPEGMLEQMKAEGTLPAAEEFARKLGNHQLKMPRRSDGRAASLSPRALADEISRRLGSSIAKLSGGRSTSSVAARDLKDAELDLNRDGLIDERDVLALGLPRPKGAAAFPSLGIVKTFALLIDFEEYEHWFPQEEFQENLFGLTGTGASAYGSLRKYYNDASYDKLDIQGQAYGWHRASKPRSYYHPDDNNGYPTDGERRNEVVQEAILAADAAGEDFSQYDNDGDGYVDYFLVIWAGPNGAWATFWWGYFGVSLPDSFVVDGVRFNTYSWQWENYHYFGETPPEPEHWDPYVTIHETGHSLGLPDYYDYNGDVGPDGGCGGMDMMDGNWGDHNSFSKYWLGWLYPTIAFSNLNDQQLRASSLYPDAVLFMPGYDPVAPWQEYFMAQNRSRFGLDFNYPSDGLVLWHVDARINEYGGFVYDNSYAEHKLLKLMQADGLEEIENGQAGANAGDYYNSGQELSPASTPNSNRYDGSATNAICNDISADGESMTADFTLYASNPPSVVINAPLGGDTISSLQPISVTCSDNAPLSRIDFIVDGQVIAQDSSGNFAANTNWNSRCEFNGPCEITVRAWDSEMQSGSATITVDVSNNGLPSFSDNFESNMLRWRSLNFPEERRGHFTAWDQRSSPPEGSPPVTGKEAFVNASSGNWCGAYDMLRSQRLDTTGFSRPLQVSFRYRCRGGFSLEASEDNGQSWSKLFDIPPSGEWTKYGAVLPLQDKVLYLRFRYQGDVNANDYGCLGANIDDVLVREAPSDPPSLQFTSHSNGDAVSGMTTFEVSGADDGGIDRVRFFVNGSLSVTDTGEPWTYERDTIWDDNNPAVKVSAIAEDGDELFSVPAEVTVAWRNARTYPAKDGFEAEGWDGWSLNNDGLQPQWSKLTDFGHNSLNCLALLPGGNWEAGNYEGLWYNGYPVPAGRRAVDLSGPDCIRPELSFYQRSDWPSDGSLTIYFYNTWFGYQWLTDMNFDAADWTRRVYDLSHLKGQSGELVFWHWGGQQTDGTGFWLDDVRVGERAPAIDALKPHVALIGEQCSLVGSGFGNQAGASSLWFSDKDGLPLQIPAENILSWSDTKIAFSVPLGAASGPVGITVDQQESNTADFYLGSSQLDVRGFDPAAVYAPQDNVALSFLYPLVPEKIEIYVDGQKRGESSSAPFGDLLLPLSGLTNGEHEIYAVSSRLGQTATSPPRSFQVFSLQGDVNGDGSVNEDDSEALPAYLGLSQGQRSYRPWFDPNLDGTVDESDISYIGYHFGESL
ncbi:M6 family metalloprotease domain-containing protein [bacterium]|nr:M6 family metalloprotease domain-containing protein [bacterium]